MTLDYLLGATLGDGCLYQGNGSYQFSITAEDRDLCEICSLITSDVFDKAGTIREVSKNDQVSYYQLVVCSKDVVHTLDELTAGKTRLPTISNSDDFIRGLMDTDGWISKVNASDGYTRFRVGFKNTACWTKDFHALLVHRGIKVGKFREKPAYRYEQRTKDVSVFSINTKDYCSKIGFGIQRKKLLAMEAIGG